MKETKKQEIFFHYIHIMCILSDLFNQTLCLILFIYLYVLYKINHHLNPYRVINTKALILLDKKLQKEKSIRLRKRQS